ncbi:glycosyltransferase [Chitinibacter sp. ZOR0017]|uniref:glycosyltransferase n=1 Tax=Chitinibacter sp. ZOR0017 TaxID=1339254 RepID=UPI000645B809|nr:glycosyltransferase [Chitinibacter sp. ZOR0017]
MKIIEINEELIKKILAISKDKNEISLNDFIDFENEKWLWIKTPNIQTNKPLLEELINQCGLDNTPFIAAPIIVHEAHSHPITPLIRNLELLSCALISIELNAICIFKKIWPGLDSLRLVLHESVAAANIRRFDAPTALNLINTRPTLSSRTLTLPEAPLPSIDEPYEEFSKEIRKGIKRARTNQFLESVQLAAEARKYDASYVLELKNRYKTEDTCIRIGCTLLPGKENLLLETINSLENQTHNNWQLYIIAFTPAVISLPNNAIWHELSDEEDSIELLNHYLFDHDGLSSIMEAGDQLTSFAFTLVIAEYHETHAAALYSNSLVIDSFPTLSKATCLPEFDSELLRRMDYFGDAFWFNPRSTSLRLDPELFSSSYYKFKLQFTIEFKNIPHRIDEIIYLHHKDGGHNFFPTEDCWAEQLKVVEQHLENCNVTADIYKAQYNFGNCITYQPKGNPKASILIPTRDNLVDLSECITSLKELTSYQNYEIIIINNGSTQSSTIEYLENLSTHENITVIQYPGKFNYSKLINNAAKVATGEILIQLNNDTVIIDPAWLTKIIGSLQQPGVGVVGVPLLFEDGSLQHASVGVGLGSVAGHYFYKMKAEETFMFFGMTSHAVPAVTGACLAMYKSLYDTVGGMDEELTTFYQDIDLCLKVAAKDFSIQFVAETALIHKESKSLRSKYEPTTLNARKPEFDRESTIFKQRWLLNPLIWKTFSRQCNLHSYWEPETQYIANLRLTATAKQNNILTISHDTGAVHAYRLEEPMRELRKSTAIQGLNHKMIQGFGLAELSLLRPNCIILQRPIFQKVTDQVIYYSQKNIECRLGVELDDLIHEVPFHNPIHTDPSFELSLKLCDNALRHADFLVTTTEFLANYYSSKVKDIRIINNFIDITRWASLTNSAPNQERLRIGWAGGSSHRADILCIKDVIQHTSSFVDWVFFGMCPNEIRPYVKEIVPSVTFEAYPNKLASLNLDLAIAPLEDSVFNRGKSHLKIIEFGHLGIPVLCSDLEPYQGDFPIIRLKNSSEWVEAINWLNRDRAKLQQLGQALKEKVTQNWILQNNIEKWKTAWLE